MSKVTPRGPVGSSGAGTDATTVASAASRASSAVTLSGVQSAPVAGRTPPALRPAATAASESAPAA